MKIYLVVRGVSGQGYTVISAHDDIADAIACAKDETLDSSYYFKIVQKSPTLWEDECSDYVEVIERTLSKKKGG